MKAVHKVSGAVVHADKAVLDRLGPTWKIETTKPKTAAEKPKTEDKSEPQSDAKTPAAAKPKEVAAPRKPRKPAAKKPTTE